MLRIYAEALDILRVRLNMYLGYTTVSCCHIGACFCSGL